MSSWPRASSAPSPTILVVDDDRRVVELLNVALTAHGYRVITAPDGEEAVKMALRERPDLLVLDVRLPKRSGLEVCEMLRQDPDEPDVPIVIVSAASETDARLQGFARGADDYLSKPFSPKELIARIKRLLTRSAEAREARRRGQKAEAELSQAREESERSLRELRREQRLREVSSVLGRDLHRELDPDALSRQLLSQVRHQIGVGVAVLLRAEQGGGPLVGAAVCGDGFERAATLSIALDGELAGLLQGLGRPMRRHELERFPDLESDLPALIAGGFLLLAPLRGPSGLEAVILLDERRSGEDFSRDDLGWLSTVCEIGSAALQNAQRCREQAEATLRALTRDDGDGAMGGAASGATDGAAAEAASRSAELIERAARELWLPPRECRLAAEAVRLAARLDRGALETLEASAPRDPSGLLPALLEVIRESDVGASERAHEVDAVGHTRWNVDSRTTTLAAVGRQITSRLAPGAPLRAALEGACAHLGERIDEATRATLRDAAGLPDSMAGRVS